MNRVVHNTSFEKLYTSLKLAQMIGNAGFSSKIIVPENVFSFVMSESGPVSFNLSDERILRGTILENIREGMTDKLKDDGFGKVTSTTNYSFIANETKKNSLFSTVNHASIYSFLHNLNNSFPAEIRDRNQQVLAYMRNLADRNIFAGGYIHYSTFSRISAFTVKLSASTDDQRLYVRTAPAYVEYNVYYMKFRYNIGPYADLRQIQGLTGFSRVIEEYVKLKRESKELVFHSPYKQTPLFDILFVPAERVVELSGQNYFTRVIL